MDGAKKRDWTSDFPGFQNLESLPLEGLASSGILLLFSTAIYPIGYNGPSWTDKISIRHTTLRLFGAEASNSGLGWILILQK